MSITETDIRKNLLFSTRAGDIVFDYRKAAFLPHNESLLVADLHFEKASFLQAKAHVPVPTYDTHDTLLRLNELIDSYRPKHVIVLGDSFHDVAAGERMSQSDFQGINQLIDNVESFTWILGNHDPDIPDGLRGQREDHVQIGAFLLTHLPYAPGEGVNICGHLHPKTQLQSSRRQYWLPCFATAQERIILPSFGTFTGGLDVTHEAIKNKLRNEVLYFAVSASGLIGLPGISGAT